jgi:GNAT superfamily N-acetyltransferase
MLSVINDAARAYHGAIPDDCYEEPYMPADELAREIEDGVEFHGWWEEEELIGIMGIQHRGEVDLIRHAYVSPGHQRRGVGGRLLSVLIAKAEKRVLVGTWAAAGWAIAFYEKNGFRLVSQDEKDRLLRAYWRISDRQIETSVVLAGPEKTAPHA